MRARFACNGLPVVFLCFRCRDFLPRRSSTRPSTTPLASYFSLEPFTYVAPYPRAMRALQLFPSAAAYSVLSARLPAISAHRSAQRTRSRFGVVVATCCVRCILLYLFQHCMTDPAFLVASLSPALITCTQSPMRTRPKQVGLGEYIARIQ